MSRAARVFTPGYLTPPEAFTAGMQRLAKKTPHGGNREASGDFERGAPEQTSAMAAAWQRAQQRRVGPA